MENGTINISPMRKQRMDDVFDAFTMLAGGGIVCLADIREGVTRYTANAVDLFDLPGEYVSDGVVDWTKYVHPEDRKRYLDAMARLAAGTELTYDLTYRVQAREGGYIMFRLKGAVLRDEDGQPGLVGGVMINEGMVENTDPVTILPNQNKFMTDLAEHLDNQEPVIILMVGIGQLNQINAVRGYSFGNRVLQQVGWVVQDVVGDRGKVYRMDGASFSVVSTGISDREMAAIYDTIRIRFQRGVRVDGIRVNLLSNGGVIATRGLMLDTWSVFHCLRFAYVESRDRFHGNLVDYNGSDGSSRSLELIGEVRNSIIEGCKGFSMRYHSIQNMETGKMIGAEALVRWQSKKFGEVEPMEFLPVLEKDFLFEELGNWILRQAMHDGARLLKKIPEGFLNVNISPIQLEDEYFTENLYQAARQTGFPLRHLCLEFTRDCRALDQEKLSATVEELHGKGVRVLIDDFGTGLDSLRFLRALSADMVKLDLHLMSDTKESQRDQQAMHCLTELASIYGLNVCVKGVENDEMKAMLKNCPVNSVQGYVWSVPADIDTVLEGIKD